MKINNTNQLAILTENRWENNIFFSSISIDARTIIPGQIFCAINGNTANGHWFVEEALAKGAVGAIVEKDYKSNISGPLFPVTSTFETLQLAATNLLKIRKNTKIVAVTGSVGKTTTKEFIYTLLEKKFTVGKSFGNQNSQIGLPITVLNDTNGNEEILILEMGMTHAGNIEKLTKIAPPHIALITQIALVHAQNFTSIDEIFQTKKEIFSHPNTKITLSPYDWSCAGETFSVENKNASFFLNGKMLYERGVKIGEVEFPFSGKHNHHNALGAISVARHCGMSIQDIQNRIPELKLYKQRYELKEKQGILFIDDSYNASAISMKAALNNLPKPKKGRFSFAIFGSMLELGKFSEQCHIEVAVEALKTVDYLFCYGKECLPMIQVWQQHYRKAYYFESHVHLIAELKCHVKEGDVVLIKGSSSTQMWKVLDGF